MPPGGALPVAAKIIGSLAFAVAPALGIADLAGVGATYGYRAVLRGALRKGRDALDQALAALQKNLDSQALFGELPLPPALPPRKSGDDAALIAAITTIT